MGAFIFKEAERTAVVQLEGEVVLETLHDLRRDLDAFLGANDHLNIDIDMSRVVFMDSSGIGFLIGLQKNAVQHGKKLRLLSPGPAIAKLLSMLKLNEFFEIAAA